MRARVYVCACVRASVCVFWVGGEGTPKLRQSTKNPLKEERMKLTQGVNEKNNAEDPHGDWKNKK